MDETEEFEFRHRAEMESKASPSLKESAVGTADAAASLLTGGIASLGGGLNYVGTLAATRDPEAAKAVKEETEQKLTYQPRTEYAKEHLANIQKPFQKLSEKSKQGGDYVMDKTGSPALSALTQTAIEGAPAALPGVPKALKRVARPLTEAVTPVLKEGAGRVSQALETRAAAKAEQVAVKAAEDAPLNAKIESARKAGFKLAPSEAGGPMGKVLEGAGGKVQTEMELSRVNAKNSNRTAARDIGLSDRQPLTEGNISRLKLAAYKVYDRVRKAGKVTFDDSYRQELKGVQERTAQEAVDFPEDFSENIQKEIAKFDRPDADAGSMLKKIQKLRERAGRNMSSQSADDFELGIAQKKIATAMENQLDRHLQATDPSLITDFRAARVKLAKIYNVEEALSPNGNISAAVLARQLKRGVPLTDGLKTIAETYQEFPKVMRYVDNLGGHAPFSALDYLVGGVTAFTHPHRALAVVGALAGRPVARSIIKSEAYQKRGIKPRGPTSKELTLRDKPGYAVQE